MSDNKAPRIIIPRNIMNKMQAYVDLCDKEISGLGTVVYDHANNGYVVKRIMLLEQEVSSSTTDLDDHAVAQALYEYREYEGKEEVAFWWHSHVNMNTFWSGTDHETMDAIGKNGLCVALVLNKKKEKRGAIVMSPKKFPMVKFDDVQVLIAESLDFKLEDIKAEIEAKVKEKVYKTYTSPSIYQEDYAWKKNWGGEDEKKEESTSIYESWRKKQEEKKDEKQMTLLGGNTGTTSPSDNYREKFRKQCLAEWNRYGKDIREAYNNSFQEYYDDQLAQDLSIGYGNRTVWNP